MKQIFTFLFIIVLFFLGEIYPQTGKISGFVRDDRTGEALIGANIIVEGTITGAASDVEGYYVILNIPPGTYKLKASMVGYAPFTIADVKVSINQTTELNFRLKDQTVQTEEVIVVASVPIVQKDISSSRVNISIKDMENLPVISAQTVIGLQAGIQGSVVRGGGADQTGWMLNGIALRDERTNQPYTNISITSVEEIQVQTGGFNAEYGNIRSGIVNVVTKEGKTDKYTVSFIGRYRPKNPKHQGNSPHDVNAFWMRPFVDDAVAWTGTKNGNWNSYLQAQYPEFEGWNTISRTLMTDEDPTNDLSPQALQRLYLFQHRKNTDINIPDYDIDFSISGYFPYISEQAGNLRFLASYKKTQEAYIVPLSRDSYKDDNFQLKFTSDVGKGMKLNVEGLYGTQTGTTGSSTGYASIYRSPSVIAENMSLFSNWKTIENRLFTYDYWCPTEIKRYNIGVKLTHAVNPTTFYDVSISRFSSIYNTNPDRPRDTTRSYLFGNNYYVDEAPNGFWELPSQGVANFRMSVGFSNSRDSSKINTYTLRFDITSQLDKFNNMKSGIEFIYSENLANYAYIDKYLPSGKYRTAWDAYPMRGSIYVQDKLEFEGMIANFGLRVDYSNPNMEWILWDNYTSAFSPKYSLGLDTLLKKEKVKANVTVSPRLGVAFPITDDSKLYFNYGHFRQLPLPEDLYLIRRYLDNNQVVRVANPLNPFPKTVAYELGYEQNILDQFLVRLAGYYKDVSEQTNLVTYVDLKGSTNYSTSQPNSYADIRGFEITLDKNRGDWIRGFINYTYMVSTSGIFGFATYYQNEVQQRSYEATTRSNYQSRPVPSPYARANIDLFTPMNFGPEVQGFYPLEDWRLSILARWQNGFYFTYVGGGSIPGIEYNMQWKDYWSVDLRFSKNIDFGKLKLQLFLDVINVFGIKYMSSDYGFADSKDWDAYMKSLHLPVEFFTQFPKDENGIPKTGWSNSADGKTYVFGSDKPGEYRTGEYAAWDDAASDSQKQEWLKNKSYIDMPNQDYFTFLNPRDFYFGLRFTWEIF